MRQQIKTLLGLSMLFVFLFSAVAFPQGKAAKNLSKTEYSQLLMDRYTAMTSPTLQKSGAAPDRAKNNMTLLLLEAKKNWNSLTTEAQAFFSVKASRPTGLSSKYDETTKNFFRFYYTTSGTNAVATADANSNGVPDYVENMAAAFIKALSFYDSAGYNRPPIAASDSGRFCVYLSNSAAGSGVYGYSAPETVIGDNPLTTLKEVSSTTAYMVMRNNYTGFGSDLQVAMEVTTAHEFFHCVQFGYDTNNMTSFSMESCATWAEDMVFPGDDDNWQYESLIFGNPDWALDYLDDENVSSSFSGHWYATWIFYRFLSDHYGKDFPKLFYENCVANAEPKAMDNVLVSKGTNYTNAIKDFYVGLALLTQSATAPQSSYSFQRANDYRTLTKPNGGPFVVKYENTIAYSGSKVSYASTSGNSRLMRASADYLKVTATGNFNIKVTPTTTTTALAARLLKLDSYTNPTTLSVVEGTLSGSDYVINVPDQASYGNYLLVVYNTKYATSTASRDASSLQYTVTIDKLVDGISLTSPVGGEAWQATTTHNITWATGSVTNTKIEYTTDNGSSWSTIVASTPASAQSYSWVVPSTLTTNAKVRLTDVANAATTSTSPAVFSIIAYSPISITAPASGISWQAGTTNNISWSATGISNIKIDYSTDNGTTWTNVTPSTPAAAGSYAWLVPSPATTTAKIQLSDAANAATSVLSGTFTITAAPTLGWELVSSGLKGGVWGIDYVNASTVWIASDSGDVAVSTNGGNTFVPAGTLDAGFIGIVGISDKIAVAATGPNSVDGNIYRTTNGGATWTNVYTKSGAWFDIIAKTDSVNLWALSDPISGKFLLVKSSDAGATWTAATSGPSAASSVYGANDSWDQIGNTIWFGTGGSSSATAANKIYKSTTGPDGPWTASTATAQFTGTVSFSSASGYGLVGFWQASNTLNRSTNGGTAWSALTATIGTTHNVAYVRGTATAYAATTNGLFKTTDNGTSWTQETLPTGVTEVEYIKFFNNGGSAAFVGGPDGVLLRKTAGTNGIGDTKFVSKAANFELFQNYPNPFNPTTNIRFSLNEHSNVSLTIYNQLGQKVASLLNGDKAAGTYEVTWNASSYPSGIYFYELKTEKFSVTKKLMLVK
jgi:hypothetical protein